MTRDEAIDKIKKLLKLAEREAGNEQEAALAAAKAQSIMDRYRIEASAIDTSEEVKDETPADWISWDDPVVTGGRIESWKLRLVQHLCKANGAAVWLRPRTGLMLFGSAEACSTIRYLYQYCAQAIDRLAFAKYGNGKVWINNYRIGCTDAIRDALRKEHDSMVADLHRAHTGTALIRVDRALANLESRSVKVAAAARERLKLRKGHGSHSQHDGGARAAGYKDGQNIYTGKRRGGIGPGTRQIQH